MPWYLRVLRGLEILLYVLFFGGILAGSNWIITTDPAETARRYTRAIEFDFVNWTADAFTIKLGQFALGSPFYFDEVDRHRIVVDYLQLMDDILTGENHLNAVYADPEIKAPQRVSLALRLHLQNLYTRQRHLAPLAEAVLQEQVAATLAELGLTTGGQPFPQVMFHISPLPYNLIISPRSVIRQDAAISLIPDLALDQQIELEGQVDAGLDVSSLVVPVGGIGSYPSMVMRTTMLDWLADTIAHEWTHNWLTLRPLGLNYETNPELRTMNETAASIAGHEVAVIVMKKYYPELAYESGLQTVAWQPGPAAGFDYRAEMHATRVHVDDLLKAGKIEEAEAYMEMRRQLFWQNGYTIRKLNQAFFAFHGAYADAPGGAAGEDPVGPAVRLLRAQSSSLADFLSRIAKMTSFEELQEATNP